MADQERKVYDFRSVGEKESTRVKNLRDTTEGLSFGIATPVQLSKGSDQLFEMNTNIVDQVVDNFRNMISTNHGERLIFTDFGANLLPLVFRLGESEFDDIALDNIKRTTEKYMPFIQLETFEPIREVSDSSGLAKVVVKIGFSIPQLGASNKMVEATIYAGG